MPLGLIIKTTLSLVLTGAHVQQWTFDGAWCESPFAKITSCVSAYSSTSKASGYGGPGWDGLDNYVVAMMASMPEAFSASFSRAVVQLQHETLISRSQVEYPISPQHSTV